MSDTNALTAEQIIKNAYPDRFYAIPDQGGKYVAQCLDAYAPQTMISSLPAVSGLIVLTAEQYAMSSGALNIPVQDGALLYPARYYATLDTPARFWDAWDVSDASKIPPVAALFPMTTEQWTEKGGDSGFQKLKMVESGELKDYTPPAPVIPLAQQASAELSGWIAQQASMAAAMGETFTDTMKNYVKSVQSIAGGADTQSNALPVRPSPVTLAE